MENNYSLGDIAAAMKDNDGYGNSTLLIVLFLLIFGFGGNGFGRNNGELNQYATAASQQQILFNQQFDALGQKINQIGDGLCSSTYALNNSIQNEGRSIQTQLCAINSNIDNKFAALEKSQLEQRLAEQAQQINQLSMQQMLCGIPKVNNTAWQVVPNACGCTGLATI